jgi:hypothetical protein
MSAQDLRARNTLFHAMQWLRSERNHPAWAAPGIYFALRVLDKAHGSFFSNRVHRMGLCLRCEEIRAWACVEAEKALQKAVAPNAGV